MAKDNVSKTINLSVTRLQRTACLYERGGYNPRTKKGYAIIICTPDGKPKKAIAIRNEENNRHALIPVEKGDICIEATKDDRSEVFQGEVCINLWVVNEINVFESDGNILGDADVVLMNNRSFGTWQQEDPSTRVLDKAIEAATQKCETPNCGEPMYVQKVRRFNKN